MMTIHTTARHTTASRAAWLELRRDLLVAEKNLVRQSDEVARLRRQLPWVRIDKSYVFDAPAGKVALADLFDGRRQLLVQHFMLAPGWQQGCKSCSFMADHMDGMTIHLAHRDVTFAAISRAPLAEIERYRRRMGWKFSWVSSHGSSFNYDFQVSFTPEQIARGASEYNYAKQNVDGEELPGISVFAKDDSGDVFHTYSTFGRGVEVMMGTYRLLDLVPKGRNEHGHDRRMGWVRHHDRYEHVASANTGCCRGGQT